MRRTPNLHLKGCMIRAGAVASVVQRLPITLEVLSLNSSTGKERKERRGGEREEREREKKEKRKRERNKEKESKQALDT
jgi:hypothetical protein